jgi:hypothetical protein
MRRRSIANSQSAKARRRKGANGNGSDDTASEASNTLGNGDDGKDD